MKKKNFKQSFRKDFRRLVQQNIFSPPVNYASNKFISVYRVSLIRDKPIPFKQCKLSNSQQAQIFIQNLIKMQGQPDREQFCIIMLDTKNVVIGLNIVSTGSLSSATVHPREVLKPAILSNSCSLILCHNHPSGSLSPSKEDLIITKKLIEAANIMGIQIHEHIIISMEDARYYSFADNGFIKKFYDEIN